LPQARLTNIYGTSEFWDASAYEVREGDYARGVPLGRAIANVRLYVLAEDLEAVPIGGVGELYVAGECLSRGYLGQPGLTAERFIASPFAQESGGRSGERMYLTGDRVRYRSDGELEFIGRRDSQVKIRGLRIELGEVEAVLQAYPGVSQAVVVVQEPAPGDKRLAGYVVGRVDQAVQVSELRSHLRRHLPSYMVPISLWVLESLPLLPNGKVDRLRLPAGPVRAEGTEHVAPRTPMEHRLASIWREVLQLQEVSIYDNFFELGGHSLLAMRVVARVREFTELDIPLRMVFDNATIMQFGEYLENLRWAGRQSEVSTTAQEEGVV
jgi:hypothetical protein